MDALTLGLSKAEGSWTAWMAMVPEEKSGGNWTSLPWARSSPRKTLGQIRLPCPRASEAGRRADGLLETRGPLIGIRTHSPSIRKGQRLGSGLLASRIHLWVANSSGWRGIP